MKAQYQCLSALFLSLALTSLPSMAGSRLLATGGVSSFEGTAGGGITPWAMIAGYASGEEITATANIQVLDTGEYQLKTFGAAIGLYDRVEISVQRQTLDISAGVVSNVFNLLTAGAITTAPGIQINQDIVGLKVRLFGDAIYAQHWWQAQLSAGLQYKKNQDFDASLTLSDGTVPLPNTGVPMLLGAVKDSGTDVYLTASRLWLGGAWGNNLLASVTARMTKANTFGLLGFESATENSYQLEWEGSLAILPSPSTAVGFEWRTQSDKLGGLAKEKTTTDFFIAYFPDKNWSLTAAYVDLGSLPFDVQAKGFYLTVTVNL